MLLSIVSVVDFSAYADVQTGKLGDNVTYSLDTETGLLTISGTGDMYDAILEELSKSTSPRVFPFISLKIPTSTTTQPGFNIFPSIIFFPTAETTISAVFVI